MKEYKMVQLNPKMHLTRKTDIQEAEKNLNEWIRQGWELHNVITPSDLVGGMVAVLYREIED